MNLKTPLNIPPIDWNRVLIIVAASLVFLFALAFVTKARTILMLADGMLALSVVGLLIVGTIALVKKLTNHGP